MLPSETIARFRVDKESGFKLADRDPKDIGGLDIDKTEGKSCSRPRSSGSPSSRSGFTRKIAGRCW